jgi:exodeoxyribonuclease VII large subunit
VKSQPRPEQLSFFRDRPRAVQKTRAASREASHFEIYTVSRLNEEIHVLLKANFPPLWLEGEISNFRHHTSGHMYFTLKDASAEIEAVMFADLNEHLAFDPADGLKVLAFGQVTLYERRGKYQIEIQQMKPAGVGRLQLEFEQLKARLQAEGLFNPELKKPIPRFPERIALVTSAEGAALRDMVKIFAQRFPLVELLVFPAKVQGVGAAQEIADSIRGANVYHKTIAPIDTLIIGRGGGSLEDLWAFNEEPVARALFQSRIPTISAVGHEVDVTMADLVADLRAPTPSAAAQGAVPEARELRLLAQDALRRLMRAQRVRLDQHLLRSELLAGRRGLHRPVERLREAQQTLDHLKDWLARTVRQTLSRRQERVLASLNQLGSLNPASILRRGFSIVERADGGLVKSAEQVAVGDQLNVRLNRGRLICHVQAKEEADGIKA